MLKDLQDFLEPAEERITFAGQQLLVRELDSLIDTAAMRDDVDTTWKLVVRCVFDPLSGAPVFTDEDIPALKRGARRKTLPLIHAVLRVCGQDIEAAEKNS